MPPTSTRATRVMTRVPWPPGAHATAARCWCSAAPHRALRAFIAAAADPMRAVAYSRAPARRAGSRPAPTGPRRRIASCGFRARVDGRPLPKVDGARHARPRARPAPAHRPGARRRAGRRQQGDRAAQPSRLVELPHLPLLRAGVELPAVRRGARAAPRRGPGRLPSLRPLRARSPSLRLRLRPRSPATAPAPSASNTTSRALSTTASSRCSASTPTPPERRMGSKRDGQVARPLSGGARRRPDRHADGRQGPRFPRRHIGGRAGRRRHPALPRFPRRGAHVRARHPARRPGGARKIVPARPRLGADDRPRRPFDPARRAARQRWLPRRGAASGARRFPIRPSRASYGSCARQSTPRAPTPPPMRCARGSPAPV